MKLFKKQKGICPFCETLIDVSNSENTEIHHVYPLNSCKNNNEKAIAKKLINLKSGSLLRWYADTRFS